MSSIITVIFVLIVIGVILYLINRYLPIDSGIKTIIYVVVLLATVWWLLSYFGLLKL